MAGALPRPAVPPAPQPARPGAFGWPALCCVLAGASALVWWSGSSTALAWRTAQWQSDPWTLWSASLAHLSGLHLMGNLLALLVLAVLGSHLHAGRRAIAAVLLAWPLGTLALGLWPQIGGYSGLSGLLCAMLAVLWFHASMGTAGPLASWALAFALAAKLLSERAWSQPVTYDPHWGFNVVVAAHLAGALSGVLCAATVWLACAARRLR